MRPAAIAPLTAFCFYRLFTIVQATQTTAASRHSTPIIAIFLTSTPHQASFSASSTF